MFLEIFHGNYIYSQSFYQKSAGRISPKKQPGSNPGFKSNKPTHYLLDYGDFSTYIIAHYNPLVRTTTKFLTALILHVTIKMRGGTLYKLNCLQTTTNGRFLMKLFHGKFIYSQSFCWKEVTEEILFFYIFVLLEMSVPGLNRTEPQLDYLVRPLALMNNVMKLYVCKVIYQAVVE